jgi:large subunit ribosomal protein L10
LPKESTLNQKRKVVEDISERIKSSKAIIFADYRGLTVEQDTEMRSAMRKAGINYTVVKNTLTRFAVKENGLDDIIPYLVGPTSMASSETDPVAPAKVLSEYAKKFNMLEIKAGIVEGKVVDLKGIKALAELPPREVLIAKALGGLNAPISGLVNVLSGNIRGLVIALKAISELKANA